MRLIGNTAGAAFSRAGVYCALEGGTGFAARVAAWQIRHLNDYDGEPVPFWLLDVPLDLIHDNGGLTEAIQLQLGEIPPAVIVIDTLIRALVGNKNDSEEMAKFIRAADLLPAAFDCLVIIVHHCGVAGGRPRGHTSLPGADDVQIAVERDKVMGKITVTIDHMKDGEASAPMASKLERVELGLDDDGDPITSCVIVPVDMGEVDPVKLSTINQLALDVLRRLADTERVQDGARSDRPTSGRCRRCAQRNVVGGVAKSERRLAARAGTMGPGDRKCTQVGSDDPNACRLGQ